MTPKRKKVQDYIIKSLEKIDQDNAKFFKEKFNQMSDQEFDKFMNALKNQDTNIFVYLPNMKKSITNNKVFELAKEFNVIYKDKIKFKDNNTGRHYYSNHEYIILELPVRRVIQYVMGKIGLPESDRRISKLTGQVIKPDKGSKISLIEAQFIAYKNLEASFVELVKFRGGDIHGYQQYKQQILNSGTVYLSSLDQDTSRPRSVKTLDAYFKAMHIDMNFVD